MTARFYIQDLLSRRQEGAAPFAVMTCGAAGSGKRPQDKGKASLNNEGGREESDVLYKGNRALPQVSYGDC